MSFVNNLRRLARADPKPAELLIPPNEIDAVVEHIRALGFEEMRREWIREKLIAGQVVMYEVPLRVIR